MDPSTSSIVCSTNFVLPSGLSGVGSIDGNSLNSSLMAFTCSSQVGGLAFVVACSASSTVFFSLDLLFSSVRWKVRWLCSVVLSFCAFVSPFSVLGVE